MVGKNNQYIQKIKQGTKVETYSIKKFKVGIASVAIGCSVFFGAGVAMAGEQISGEQAVSETTISKDTPKTESKSDTATVTEKQQTTTKVENNVTQSQPNAISKETEKQKDVVNTKKLEDLLSEIDKLNLSNYTEESVKVLQEKVAKTKEVLTNATTQKEIDSAYNALVSYKNSGLKRVPKLEGNNTPKSDTTNGKETLGKKAENTEPNGENIAGHNHSMNRTSMPEGSGFREASTELTDVQMGLVDRKNGKDNITDTYIRVVKGGIGYVRSSLRVKAISASDPITDLEITGNNGFPLTPKKEGLNSKEATVSFEGNTPNTGSWKITVTAVTQKGRKSFNFEYYTVLQKPTIETTSDQLRGQADSKPSVTIKSPEKPGAFNGRAKLRVYLIRGGADLTAYGAGDQGAYPENYTILASKDVAPNGITTITENDYIVPKIGAGTVKAITVLELSGKENDRKVGERGSYMSDERTVTAAPTLDKNGAKNEVEQAFTDKSNQIEHDNSLTNEEKTEVKGLAETEKNNAIQNIENAQDETTLNAAKNSGITNIGNVTLSRKAKKAEAIAEIDAAQKAKEKAIEDNADIAQADKAAAKAPIATEANKAKGQINTANAAADVTTAKEAGLLAINKAEAIAEIKAALEAKEKTTDEDKSLTKGQKTSIKEIAKKEAMTATVKIKSATTNKEVEETKIEGIEKIKAAYAKNAELAAELTLPKLIITKWEDEEGNELRPADAKAPAEPGGANEALAHGEIAGYEFVATRDAGEVVTHIFRKLPKKSPIVPIVEERQLPVVEKVNTKTVLPNTGANTTNTGLAGLGLSVLGAVLMTARQRRKNK